MFRLREICKDDMTEINKWRNSPELINYLGAPFRYINEQVDLNWFDDYMKQRNNSVRCAIISESNEIIGLVSLTEINYINRSAVFQIMIGESKNRGNGAGNFATKTILNHAFNNLNLNRVELTVLENNISAINFYESNGFICEGRKRQSNYKNGKYFDMLMYSILKDEFNDIGV